MRVVTKSKGKKKRWKKYKWEINNQDISSCKNSKVLYLSAQQPNPFSSVDNWKVDFKKSFELRKNFK